MNDIRLRGLGTAGTTPPVARARTITRKLFEPLNGHSGMPQEAPRLIQADGLDNKSPASSRQVWRIRLQSFTGLSAASIDASIVTRNSARHFAWQC